MSCAKISRHRQLNAYRMEITMCTGNCKTTFLKMDPGARKLQESGNKQNKIYQIMYTSNQ